MKIVKNEAVISRKEDNGEAFLFNTHNGQFKRLNNTGAIIWENCDGLSYKNIVDILKKKYPDMDDSRIESDVDMFINELNKRGLISITE